MDGFEVLAVIVFFLVGYWIVDFFWPKKKPLGDSEDRKPPNPENKA